VSQPPENPNPYESPHSQASEEAAEALPGDLARWARRGNVTNDVLVVIGAIVWLVILSAVGADFASTAASFGAFRLGGAIATWHWIGWGAMLIARFPGQFLGGWMLGRFLRRINPWSVGAGLVIYMGLVCVWLIASADPGNRDYVAEIGLSAYVAQVIANVLVAWAVVFGGTWLGRKGQRVAAVKWATTTACSQVPSMMAACFRVGREEVHEIGFLLLPSGREIYTVDGREKLNVRSFGAVRGSRHLSVGDREPHEIVIRWRLLPLWSAQAFVDGELSIKELFPDLRLLLVVMGILPPLLVAFYLVMFMAALTLLLAT
jgi:hypothetical protein